MTSDVTPKTILLKGSMTNHGEAQAATATIKPGMLLEMTTAGKVTPAATENSLAPAKMFARESSYAGGDIDDTFAADDTVPYWVAAPGDQIYAFLEIGANVSIGAALAVGAEDGSLGPSSTAGAIIARAVEAINNTSGAIARIKVEIL